MSVLERPFIARTFYFKVALLGLSLFLVGTNAFVIAGLLPDIAHTLHVHPNEVSYSITYYSIVVGIGAPTIAITLPRLSRKVLMGIGLLLIAGGTLLAAASQDIELFTIGRVIAGLGGAAVVPSATAAAAAIAPPERRGRAIAFVAVGFTSSLAFGSPLGTAIGAIDGWQLPLYCVAGLAFVLGILFFLFLGDIPKNPPVPFRRRFGPLRDPRVVLTLIAAAGVTGGFNLVYIFSSVVTHRATGGDGGQLALLLLLYGIGGVIGALSAGQVVDRIGSRFALTTALAAQIVLLLLLPVVARSLVGTAIVFGLWGVVAMASQPAIQHRLVSIDPPTSTVAVSWYSTASYTGIGAAPLLGSLANNIGGAEFIPVMGAAVIAISFITIQLGFFVRRDRAAIA